MNVGALYSNKYDNTCIRQLRGQQNYERIEEGIEASANANRPRKLHMYSKLSKYRI
jgi:hypothetical protein